MRYIYLSGAMPEKVCDFLSSSVAGNKFSLNMAKAIDDATKGALDFFSFAQFDGELLDKLCQGEIWAGKKVYHISKGKKFLLSDIIQAKKIYKAIKAYTKQYKNEQIVILLENSPTWIADVCVRLRKNHQISCYSITIDTPFTDNFSAKGLIGTINYRVFKRGFKLLKKFTGLITFTKEALHSLNLDIPCLEFAIGCNKSNLPGTDFVPEIQENPIRKVAYTGTFIYYNGIKELLDAFVRLGKKFELHMYGYGPLEPLVETYADKESNIFFHGRFSPYETQNILQEYDLLVNPRIFDPKIENFTFPSKIIDYIIAGKNIVSSRFKTLPKEYNEFLYLIEEVNSKQISEAIEAVFMDSKEVRVAKICKGISYLRNYQTYDVIADKILDFFANNY